MFDKEMTGYKESLFPEQWIRQREGRHWRLSLFVWFSMFFFCGVLAAGAIFTFPLLERNPLIAREEQAFVPLVAVHEYNTLWARAIETQNPALVANYVKPGSHEESDLRQRIAYLRSQGTIERSELVSLIITDYKRVDLSHVQVKTHEVWRYAELPAQGTPPGTPFVQSDTEDEVYTFVFYNGHWLLETVTFITGTSSTITGNGL